eukprot:974138-Rhodomonas_salina.1
MEATLRFYVRTAPVYGIVPDRHGGFHTACMSALLTVCSVGQEFSGASVGVHGAVDAGMPR